MIRTLNDSISVAAQIVPDDVAAIKDGGFRCRRQ